MNADITIQARQLDKRYRLYGRPIDRVKEWVTRRRRHQEVWALKGIDFEVPRGSALGLVGSNGAGKSTLLKILAGTTVPTSGSYEVRGKVASLLELGTGFSPGFSGYQNIFLNGMVMGFSREEMRAKVDEIIEFSELGAFIHQPIRTYSSGMIMRLGFSVATAIDPDVLIIDEILAVGDMHFQKRCIDRIMSFRAAGKTILFCSHSMYHVEEICDQALWVQEGRARMLGKSGDVCRAYERYEQGRRSSHGTPGVAGGFEDQRTLSLPSDVQSEGGPEFSFSGDLPQVLEVRILRPDGTKAVVQAEDGSGVVSGAMLRDDVRLEIDYELPKTLPGMILGCIIFRSDQEMMTGLGSQMSGFELPLERGHYTATLDFPRFPLLHGEYKFNCYLADARGLHVYHSLSSSGRFLIRQESRYIGMVELDHNWSVRRRVAAGQPPDPAVGANGQDESDQERERDEEGRAALEQDSGVHPDPGQLAPESEVSEGEVEGGTRSDG